MESLNGFLLHTGLITPGIAGTLVILLALGFLGAPLILWAIAVLAALFAFGAPLWMLASAAVIFAIFLIKPVRRLVITKPVMSIMAPIMPSISETERTALEAGVVWVEGELFS